MFHVGEIIYVPGSNKKFLSVLVLEYKGSCVIIMENQAFLWSKKKSLDDAAVIGVQEGELYMVPRKYLRAMVHHTIIPCKLWHWRLYHLHYKALARLQ